MRQYDVVESEVSEFAQDDQDFEFDLAMSERHEWTCVQTALALASMKSGVSVSPINFPRHDLVLHHAPAGAEQGCATICIARDYCKDASRCPYQANLTS